MQVLMVAAENDALPGAKVGGIADVVRDLPRALAAKGHDVSVVVPSYGVLHELAGARRRAEFDVADLEVEFVELRRRLDQVDDLQQVLIAECRVAQRAAPRRSGRDSCRQRGEISQSPLLKLFVPENHCTKSKVLQ